MRHPNNSVRGGHETLKNPLREVAETDLTKRQKRIYSIGFLRAEYPLVRFVRFHTTLKGGETVRSRNCAVKVWRARRVTHSDESWAAAYRPRLSPVSVQTETTTNGERQ